MTLLQVGSLSFGHGADLLFSDLTFTVASGDRLAVVAPNGAGKSTLLRLIAGEIPPISGTSVIRRGTKLGYYRQSHEVSGEGSVLDAFLEGFGNVIQLRHDLSRAQHAASSGAQTDLDRLANLMDRYHLAGGDELERKIGIVAEKLGFLPSDMERSVTSLSGGERGRLRLGVVLTLEPDLLLLDEPTNHLDLDTIRWLEGFLSSFSGGLIIVSHDRAFLENTTTATLELGRRTCRLYPCSFGEYQVARAADLERETELAERQEAMVAKTEEFIRRNIAGQKTKQAQSRRKMLDKLDRLDRPEDVWRAAEKLAFRFSPAPRSGDIVLECKGLGASRSGKTLFSGLDLLLRRGERLAIVGPNGAGKTTLLKKLAGTAPAEDQGEVKRGSNLREAYFDQNLGSLDEKRTAVEEIRSIRGDMNIDVTRQYLARFKLTGDDTLRQIKGFSGGERTRLALAKMLLEPINLLFLDEPTNHLDIPSAAILEEALIGFEGTLVFVSHDRRFLENVSTRLVVVRDGAATPVHESYGEWTARLAAETEARPAANVGARPSRPPNAPSSSGPPSTPPASPEAKKASYEEGRQNARAKERRKRRLAELEDEIAEAEQEQAALRVEIAKLAPSAWEELAQRTAEDQDLGRKIEALFSEWAELNEETS